MKEIRPEDMGVIGTSTCDFECGLIEGVLEFLGVAILGCS